MQAAAAFLRSWHGNSASETETLQVRGVKKQKTKTMRRNTTRHHTTTFGVAISVLNTWKGKGGSGIGTLLLKPSLL